MHRALDLGVTFIDFYYQHRVDRAGPREAVAGVRYGDMSHIDD